MLPVKPVSWFFGKNATIIVARSFEINAKHFMMDKQAFGYIVKKEQLESFSAYSKREAMLLVASKPFPGFNGDVNKDYYYLVLDGEKQIQLEELIRLIQTIRNRLSSSIDICASDITLYNKSYQSFRICSDNLELIHDIVSHFMIYGLRFLKNQLVKPFISQIKVFKYFELEEINAQVYRNRKSPEFKYFQFNNRIEWEEFEHLITKAGRNDLFNGCDFALASLYSKKGIDDYIRVFSDKCTPEKITLFKGFIETTLQKHIIK
jgi:hypothetical protein